MTNPTEAIAALRASGESPPIPSSSLRSFVLTTISARISSSGCREHCEVWLCLGNVVAALLDLPRRVAVDAVSECGLSWWMSRCDVDKVDRVEAGSVDVVGDRAIPVLRFREILFPMPLFCPNRAFLELVPIMAPRLDIRWSRKNYTKGGRGTSQYGHYWWWPWW